MHDPLSATFIRVKNIHILQPSFDDEGDAEFYAALAYDHKDEFRAVVIPAGDLTKFALRPGDNPSSNLVVRLTGNTVAVTHNQVREVAEINLLHS